MHVGVGRVPLRGAVRAKTIASMTLVLAACAIALASAAEPGGALSVTGYQEEGSPVSAIARSASAMTTVGVDGVNLVPSGHAVGAPDRAALRQLAAAHAHGLKAILLVGNWSNAANDFSEPLAHRLLSSPAAIAAVAGALARAVSTQGWDGISVDLESLTSRDRDGLTRFLVALRAALPQSAWLAIDVQNDMSASAYADNGYDLHAIGTTVDEVVLMAYDQHGSWERQPGPVGARWWARKGLGVVLRSVPAAKVTLGVAGYGYVWRPHGTVMISDARARTLVARDHASARYVARLGEWTATLSDGSVVWWSDARSYAWHATLARALGLHGLAVWSLGMSDPLRAS
jgi:spore germination protein YaaH